MTEQELQAFEEGAKTFDKKAELQMKLLISEIRVLDAKWQAQGTFIQKLHEQNNELGLEINRLRSEIAHLRDSGLCVNAEDIWQALPKVCEAILKGEEWSI